MPLTPLPAPWLVTPEWVEARRREWGEESDAFRVRVLGEFPRASADSLIELAWVERAEGAQGSGARGQGSGEALAAPSELTPDPRPLSPVVFGLDVARFGDCETVLAVRRGDTLVALERWSGADLMQTCGRVMAAARRERPERIVIDSVGLGAGVVDRLRELQRERVSGRAGTQRTWVDEAGRAQRGGRSGVPGTPWVGRGEAPLGEAGVRIVAFASGERASDPAKWKSQRDEAYWSLRERYREGRIQHQGCWSGLTGQLTALHYRFTSRGQLEIESKDELRQRGLPSPDQADAVALAFAPDAPSAFLPTALAAPRPVIWPLPRLMT